MDFSLCCRGCMKEPLTEETDIDETIVKMFTFCTSIEVSMEDGLPCQFCKPCTDSIQSCCTFITTARQSNRRMLLAKTYSKPNTFKLEDTWQALDPLNDMKTPEIKSEPNFNMCNENKLINADIKSEPNSNIHSEESKFVNTDEDRNIIWMQGTHLKDEPSPNGVLKLSTPQENEENKKNKTGKKTPQKRLIVYKRKRTKVREFGCDSCSKKFFNQSHLLKHQHVHDSTLKIHLCDVCGSRFSNNKAMQDHRLVHTAIKPFSCEQCSYSTRVASNLRRHQRAHLNQRPHVCPQCHKGFNESLALKTHMYAHTGERPFKCPQCEGAFRNSDKRKKHLIRAHGMQPSEIPRMSVDGGPARRHVTEDSTRKPYSVVAERNKSGQTHAGNQTEN